MEHIKTPKIDNVKLVNRHGSGKPITGSLFITATHLIFMDPSCSKETWVLHMHIASIEKLPLTPIGCPIKITCKTFHILNFVLPRERDCLDVIACLNKLSQPDKIENLFAFQYRHLDGIPKMQGWDFYDMRSEYLRMGAPNENWILSKLNHNYELCDTYPRWIYVPSSATTPMIYGSCKFRSRERLPALSYLHRDNQAVICRCSQPLAGFSARCIEDEQLLNAILKANPTSKTLHVVDTRPKLNALANRAGGKGYESESFYSNIKFKFVGIENIHVMRNSLEKLIEISDSRTLTMTSFLNALEECGWLKHIRAVLETSLYIANKVERGESVVVHCSDGWDRTAQTCSLASIVLDPYYRTIQGYQALIEKEWLSFGHKFTDRCGLLGCAGDSPREQSPVFTQFVDATWQLLCQFPRAFQFNERFLLTIHDHVYSCQFGTFIGNCEKDRLDLRLSDRTYSLWGFLALHNSDYTNPLYSKEYELVHPVLKPQAEPQFIRYWKGLYNRFERSVHVKESVPDVVSALKDHNILLEDHVKLLEKRVQSLAAAIGRPVDAISQKLQGLLSDESIYCLSALLTGDDNNSKMSDSSSQPARKTENTRKGSSLNGTSSGNGETLTSTSENKEINPSNRSSKQEVSTDLHGFKNDSCHGSPDEINYPEESGSADSIAPGRVEIVVGGDTEKAGTLIDRTQVFTEGTLTPALQSVPKGCDAVSVAAPGVTGSKGDDCEDTESGFEDGASQWSKSQVLSFDEANGSSFISFQEVLAPVSIASIHAEVDSVSVSWQSLRAVSQCPCAAPFEHFSKKYHCWRCGLVHCQRCVSQHLQLPGLASHKPVPVCKTCYKTHKLTPPVSFSSGGDAAKGGGSDVSKSLVAEMEKPRVAGYTLGSESAIESQETVEDMLAGVSPSAGLAE